MPELGYEPVNKYLPPRPRRAADSPGPKALPPVEGQSPDTPAGGLFRWLDSLLSR
jgi:hypothetical protein